MRRHRIGRRPEEQGFTLIELLIVIVILGILAGIVVFSVGGITDRGSRSACQANVETINIASEAYRTQNTGYAPNLTDLLGTGSPNTQFLKSIPGTVSGNSFTVTNAGGSDYTVSYDPATGLATSTCPAGNSGSTGSTGSTGGGGGPTTSTSTTTLAPCAFGGFAPGSVSVNGSGNISSGTATATFTGNCSAITAVQLEIDKNASGGFGGGGEDHGAMAGSGGTWTDGLSTSGWTQNRTVTVRITVTGGSLGVITTSMLTLGTGTCSYDGFSPNNVDANNSGVIAATTFFVDFEGDCASAAVAISAVVVQIDRNDAGGYQTGESHTLAAVAGTNNALWSVALPTTGWNDNEEVTVRITVTKAGASIGPINTDMDT